MVEHAPSPDRADRWLGAVDPTFVRAMLAVMIRRNGGTAYVTEEEMNAAGDLTIIQASPESDGYPSWLIQEEER